MFNAGLLGAGVLALLKLSIILVSLPALELLLESGLFTLSNTSESLGDALAALGGLAALAGEIPTDSDNISIGP